MTVAAQVAMDPPVSSVVVDDGSTTAVIEELYPTATFEIRVVALSNNSNYGIGIALDN